MFSMQSQIPICFLPRPSDSTYPSRERWLSATVYGIYWQPGELVVYDLVCSQAAMDKKSWNKRVHIAFTRIQPTYSVISTKSASGLRTRVKP